jgi:3-hydroxyacyl-CoA dehydrogenase
MSQTSHRVRRAAVLGAGVMGAQIAAHFVNAGVPAMLFDLSSAEGPANALARTAAERLRKLEPAPLALAEGARPNEAAD